MTPQFTGPALVGAAVLRERLGRSIIPVVTFVAPLPIVVRVLDSAVASIPPIEHSEPPFLHSSFFPSRLVLRPIQTDSRMTASTAKNRLGVCATKNLNKVI